MRVRLIVGSLVLAVATGSGVMAFNNPFAAKTVKEVMKIAHKDGLKKKIEGGSASDECRDSAGHPPVPIGKQ